MLVNQELPAECPSANEHSYGCHFLRRTPSHVYQRRMRVPERRRQAPGEISRLGLGSLRFWGGFWAV